jgi:uncharacterized membrane protein HdeD (DUF308 family)
MNNNFSFPYLFRMLLGVAYIALGVFVLTTDKATAFLGNRKSMAIVLGILCIIYGCFRIYRNQKNWDQPKHEE